MSRPRAASSPTDNSAHCVGRLADCGALRTGSDPVHAADACWALTTTAVFAKLTIEAGWDGAAYQRWLADVLTATLL
ncbi:hypothetical protein [Streptomyces sp. HUAS TT7]|uniref:hypothetical protein n=1 Tax=Streptomyces sp. HUAS TT7 TaxID=3447507 RepID=UPI003F65E1E7